jgi:hypothetical protein
MDRADETQNWSEYGGKRKIAATGRIWILVIQPHNSNNIVMEMHANEA